MIMAVEAIADVKKPRVHKTFSCFYYPGIERKITDTNEYHHFAGFPAAYERIYIKSKNKLYLAHCKK